MATLNVTKRDGKGKYAAFGIRKAGRLPGVVYGKSMGQDTLLVSMDRKELLAVLKTGDRLIDLVVDGAPRKAILKDVQFGNFESEVLHADFRAVSENETIEVTVELILTGEAPGVAAGGMLEMSMHSVTVRCQPKDIPHEIRVDVSALNLGEIIYVDQLPQFAGVQYVVHGRPAVVTCHLPKKAEDEEAAEGEGAATSPEVIGEKEREERATAKDDKKK